MSDFIIKSENIADLAKALAKAQGEIKNAAKDSTNPHFKSKYADLASVREAMREPFANNGLSLLQPLSSVDNKIACTTIVLHESGQYIGSTMTMTPQQNTPQGQGSCATYIRRYMGMAVAGIAPDDDDGNEASMKGNSYAVKSNQTKNPVVQSAVVEAAPASNPDAAACVEKFSKTNTRHIKAVASYVAQKNQPKLFDVLARRLEGKAFNRATIEAEWAVIDPERPDKEPEGGE